MNYTGNKGKVAVLLFEAKTRPDAAAELPEMAAEYLRAGEVMPEALAEYLAIALDKAAKANGADRGDVLAQELMMKQSANAPTKGREFDLLLAIVKHDAKVQSLPKRISKELKKSLPEGVTVALRPLEKELVTEVMVALGVGERTAKQRIKEARVGMAYTLIDLDVKPGEEPTELQRAVLEQFPGYAEISPSGRGLHIVVKGFVPKGRKTKQVEIYSSGRYMTMTGDVHRPGPIIDCNDRLAELWAYLGGSQAEETSSTPLNDANPASLISDDNLRESVCGSPANADNYFGRNVADWSASYFALICAACLFSSDEAQVRRVVMASPLVQNSPPKGDETRLQKATRMWGDEYTRAARRGAQERQQRAQATAHGAQIAAAIGPQPVGSPRSRLRSARDLQHTQFAPLKVVIDYIVEGLSFLASVPKLGKSWEALAMGIAKAKGGEFRGQLCEPGNVLLLALEACLETGCGTTA